MYADKEIKCPPDYMMLDKDSMYRYHYERYMHYKMLAECYKRMYEYYRMISRYHYEMSMHYRDGKSKPSMPVSMEYPTISSTASTSQDSTIPPGTPDRPAVQDPETDIKQ